MAFAVAQDSIEHPRQLPAAEAVHKRCAQPEDWFQILLERGLWLRAAILAEGAIQVSLADPQDREIVKASVAPGVEVPVSAIGQAGGRFTIRVRTAAGTTSPIAYRFRVCEVRPARPDDAARLAADRLVLRATTPASRAKPEAARTALRDYDQAHRSYLKLHDEQEAVRVLMRTGRLLSDIGECDRAVETLQSALELSRQSRNPALEAEALVAASALYVLEGKGSLAVTASTDALQRARSIGDRWLEASALLSLGDARSSVSELNDGMQLYAQGAALWRELEWKRGEAEALLNIGYNYTDLGEEDQALDALTRSAAAWQELGDVTNRSETLRALGSLYFKRDEKQKALSYYDEALQLLPPAIRGRQRAVLLNAFGWIYLDLGRLEDARRRFTEALEIARKTRFLLVQGAILHQLGLIATEMRDYARAREYYQDSLAMFRDMGNLRWAALLTVEIALVHLLEGDTEAALAGLNSAMPQVRAHADPYIQSRYLAAIGLAYHRQRDYDRASKAYGEALNLLQAGGYRYREARTRLQVARLESDRGNLEQARRQFESAIEVIESVRTDIPGPELRASYFSSTHDYFEFYTGLLMRLAAEKPGAAFDAQAFQVSERGRARSLLDSLAEAKVQIREGVDADLLSREAGLKRRLNRAAERQEHLPAGDPQTPTARAEVRKLTAEYEQVSALIRTRSPNYAALTQPQPLALAEVQRGLLDRDTVLLEYALGEQQSYLWAVSAGAYESHRLPGRTQLEAAVLRVRELLTARETRPGETVRDRRRRIDAAEKLYWTEAARLSKVLLGPVAAFIRNKRLLIVGDGALQYVPFAALPAPDPAPAAKPGPLVLSHEVVRLPSASTLAVLRQQAAARNQAEKWLAVLADPVFDTGDPRIGGTRANPGFDTPGAVRFPRLPSARMEAEAIAALAPAARTMTAVGFDASRALAASGELAKYRIVHFATHSILHHEHPELSGVALSMFDRQGRRLDGLLRLHDIYNLRLPVDLVVLSSCESYVGKEVRGEGPMGIVRGFMYAGASRVIASLWKVDDAAAKELMVRFYGYVFGKRESPASALRHAQIDMWRDPEWQAPHYWAGFVLQGEWR